MKKAISFFLIIWMLMLPSSTSASPLPYFGGYDAVTVPCTCSPGIFWHFFAPLYFSFAPAPTIAGAPLAPIFAGAFAAPPIVAFSVYALHPFSYALGTYVPGVPACWVGIPPYCIYLPEYGVISPATGVSPVL